MNDEFNPARFEEEIKKHQQESSSKDLDISTLQEFEITDGKTRDEEEFQKMKDLEEILGIRQVNPYGTLNRDIFEEKLGDMTMTDMQSLAMQVGFPPTRDRHALKRGLAKSFDSYLKQHGVGAFSQPKPVFDENSPNYKDAVKLFNE